MSKHGLASLVVDVIIPVMSSSQWIDDCGGGEFVQLAAVGGMPTVALGAKFLQLRPVAT